MNPIIRLTQTQTKTDGDYLLKRVGLQIKEDKKQPFSDRLELIFLRLASAQEALARVAQRVKQGGHHIPEAVIRRRFAAGLDNLSRHYAPAVDAWALYDNSGEEPILLNWSEAP